MDKTEKDRVKMAIERSYGGSPERFHQFFFQMACHSRKFSDLLTEQEGMGTKVLRDKYKGSREAMQKDHLEYLRKEGLIG